MPHNDIVVKILASRKYKSVYPQTVERIVEFCSKRYPHKQVENESKKKLHQIYSAFDIESKSLESFIKKISKESRTDQIEILKSLLALHHSTKERIADIDKFYSDIFEVTGVPDTILDIGCAFNPLTLPWMNLSAHSKYYGFDLDIDQIEFLTKILSVLQLECQFELWQSDVFVEPKIYNYYDIIFLFKELQVFEIQEKGFSKKLLENLNCKYIVITFPRFSLSGKNVGMQEFYSEFMDKILADTKLSVVKKLIFTNEICYIVKK